MGSGRNTRILARAVAWPLTPALLVAALLVERYRPGSWQAGLDVGAAASVAPYVVGMLVCWAVGVLLTARSLPHVAGWAFVGLGTALAWSAFTDVYADVALHSDAEPMPLATLMATFAETSFIWWFLFLALGLQLTPAGRPTARPWRFLPHVTVASAVAFQAGALLRSTPLEEPNAGITSPWAIEGLATPAAALAFVAVITAGLCVLASVYLLVSTFRRAQGEDRQQLLWLVAGATPLAPCLVASFAASFAGSDEPAGFLMSAAIVALVAGAGFSIAKYRLYDVERVVSESASYALASGAVVAAFGLVVLVITRSIPTLSSTAWWPTSVATLAAVAVARPAYLWARNTVDRRFNKRRFDAVQIVRAGLGDANPDVEALLRRALDDPGLRILFPVGDRGWVTSSGIAAAPGQPAVDLVRRDEVGARIEFDPGRSERGDVQAVADEAAAEIDNLGLRAELARQVEQITESRARLASAHLEERHRIERDLHDGAQQRILAIALQLQSARVNGGEDVLREEVDRAISHLGLTVQELRDLAAGLQPAALASGGLRAAIEDLASRIPLRLELDVVDARFPPTVESAAWFVVAEAVSNAVKHAHVDKVTITVTKAGPHLEVAVTDCGVGGAQARGSGLQGLADRVSALGGSLSVLEQQPRGTRVEARFPCA